jgi:hypothetical protein
MLVLGNVILILSDRVCHLIRCKMCERGSDDRGGVGPGLGVSFLFRGGEPGKEVVRW